MDNLKAFHKKFNILDSTTCIKPIEDDRCWYFQLSKVKKTFFFMPSTKLQYKTIQIINN